MPLVTRQFGTGDGALYRPDGTPLANQLVRVELIAHNRRYIDVIDAITGEDVAGIVEATTDLDGKFSMDVWPNNRGAVRSHYLFTVVGSNYYKPHLGQIPEGTGEYTLREFWANGVPLSPQQIDLLSDHKIDPTAHRLTEDISDALAGAASPSSTNVFATIADVGGGGGVSDHGELTGLGDDDHSQYHNDTRGDVRYYQKSEVDTFLLSKEDKANKGVADGYAELDSSGKVPASQLPAYVDDVLEYADFTSLPAIGETGKIYVTLDDNKTYRWSGSAYVEVSSSLSLGETSSTAYRGDRGKLAYDHSLRTDNPHGVTAEQIGVEPGATADQTGAEIKSLYEAEPDTNAYTDAEKAKLGGVEDGADVTSVHETSHADVIVDGDFPTNGTMERTGAGAYTTILNKRDATAAPAATDDSAAGYSVGSRWIDVTNNKEYVCLDNTATAAVWVETTGGGAFKTNSDTTISPNTPIALTSDVDQRVLDLSHSINKTGGKSYGLYMDITGSYDAVNNKFIDLRNDGSTKFSVRTVDGQVMTGSGGIIAPVVINNSISTIRFSTGGWTSGTGATGAFEYKLYANGARSSGIHKFVNFIPDYSNNTGTSGWTAIDVDVTDGTGTGDKRLLKLAVGSIDKFTVDESGNVYCAGYIGVKTKVQNKTDNFSISASDSGTTYTTKGTSGAVNGSLPPAEAGLWYKLYVGAAYDTALVAAAGDTIRRGSDVSVAGGNIKSNVVGDIITIEAINDTEWVVLPQTGGTWTVT